MRHLRMPAVLSTVVPAAACSDATTGPVDTTALSHEISSNELGQALETAPARIEIKLERGTLVAREVELKTSDEMTVFGAFQAADCFYAPVVFRFLSYGVPLAATARAYCDAITAHPSVAKWRAAALREPSGAH